jgi:hypothetical protein
VKLLPQWQLGSSVGQLRQLNCEKPRDFNHLAISMVRQQISKMANRNADRGGPSDPLCCEAADVWFLKAAAASSFNEINDL